MEFGSYSPIIQKLLIHTNPEVGIEYTAVEKLSNLFDEVLVLLVNVSSTVEGFLSFPDIERATQTIFPKDLYEIADKDGVKRLNRFYPEVINEIEFEDFAIIPSENNSDTQPLPLSADIIFQRFISLQAMKSDTNDKSAAIYTSGILETLFAKILRQAAALCLRENKNEITLSHINKILVEDNILISLKVNMTTEKQRLEEKLKEPVVSTNLTRVDTVTKLDALLKDSFETNEKQITEEVKNTQDTQPVEAELPQTPTVDQTSQESIIEKQVETHEITHVEPADLRQIEIEKLVDIPIRKKITFKSLLYSKPYDYENILLVMFASLGIFVIESLCRECRYDVYI